MNYCEKHEVTFPEEYDDCHHCVSAKLAKLQYDVKAWKEAYYHVRELIGKNYWEIPDYGYLIYGQWKPYQIRKIQRAALYTDEMLQLLARFFWLIDLVKGKINYKHYE